MLDHPFLRAVRDGTLPDAAFARWLRQDHLFVAGSLPFLGALLAGAREPARPGTAGPDPKSESGVSTEEAGSGPLPQLSCGGGSVPVRQ